MTQQNLRKMIFMLFEEGLMDDVLKTYNDYRYMINDISLEIINLVAKAYTSKSAIELKENLKLLWESVPTVEFPNLKNLVSEISKQAVKDGLLKKENLPKEYFSSSGQFYQSPGYKVISINGTKFENTLNLESLLRDSIKDKVIFRENIDKVEDLWYRNHLKLIHSIETQDIDYGLENCDFFLNFTNSPQTDEQCAPYLLIIELFEAKQRLNPDLDVSKDPKYTKLCEVLRDSKYILNAVYLKHWHTNKLEFYKLISEAKKHLVSIGFNKDLITEYSERFLRF